MSSNIIFLKLGGSLITNKDVAYTAREEVINRLANEIKQALEADSSIKILLGHGSGSFGHFEANKYGTIKGVKSTKDWIGFYKVSRAASKLHHLVINIINKTGLKCFSFAPLAMVTSEDRKIIEWNINPISVALDKGFIPVIYGDVIFDNKLGGTIFSTEDLFSHLAGIFHPKRILLAGIEDGIWKNFPEKEHLIPSITSTNYQYYVKQFKKSSSIDVTGGMAAKISVVMEIIKNNPAVEVQIFSGLIPSSLFHSLIGERKGTQLIFN